MILKKILFLFTISSIGTFSLFSEEILKNDYDNFSYYSTSLQAEESRLSSSEGTLYDQLIFVRKMHDIVVDFLNTAAEEHFYEQLRMSKSSLEKMAKTSEAAFYQIFPDKYNERHPFDLNGVTTSIYYNLFSHRTPLTEKERTAFYQEEIQRHQNVKLLPKKLLTLDVLKDLVSGQTYNFAVTVQNEVYISYNQRYRLKNAITRSILISPNHTMLAGNAPLLSAGVFNVYKVGKKELYVISCSSGHFHPLPDSMVHMKNYLQFLGVPEEAIILFSVAYDKLDSQTKKIRYGIPAKIKD